MLTHRLQILLDDDRHRKVTALARSRGVPVAVVVREAIDRGLAAETSSKQAALARILAAEPMQVSDPEGLRAELDELRGRSGRFDA